MIDLGVGILGEDNGMVRKYAKMHNYEIIGFKHVLTPDGVLSSSSTIFVLSL